MLNLRPFELFLIEFAFYILLWLWNDYIATLVSALFILVCTSILLIALVAELIERSKVPRRYFYYMLVSILAPLLSSLFFINQMNGNLDWLEFSF